MASRISPQSHGVLRKRYEAGSFSQDTVSLRARRRAARLSDSPKFGLYYIRLTALVLVLVVFAAHLLYAQHVSADREALKVVQLQAAAISKQKANVFAANMNRYIYDNPQLTLSVTTVSARQPLRTYGAATAMDGASTAKLLTAADYLHHVEQHSASLSQRIDGQSAGDLLRAMLVDSDDSAWSSLNGYLTHADLLHYAALIGFKGYDIQSNSFTAADVAKVLQQLQTGNLLNADDRSLVLRYLSQANHRDYIVAAVMPGDRVYHKIGMNDDTVNDAALITHGSNWMIIVIFTNGNGSYDWVHRQDLFQAITRDATRAFL